MRWPQLMRWVETWPREVQGGCSIEVRLTTNRPARQEKDEGQHHSSPKLPSLTRTELSAYHQPQESRRLSSCRSDRLRAGYQSSL